MRLRGALGLFNNEEVTKGYASPKYSVQNAQSNKLKIDEVEGLKDKLHNLESILGGSREGKSKIMKAEEEIIGLNRHILQLEDSLRKSALEKEHVEDQKKKVYSDLQSLARTHEDLKAKSLELINRMSKAEAENNGLRDEKNKLVENILALQRNHQEELQVQRDQLDSLTEKMYILNLEHENKQTVLELEKKFEREKEAYRDEIFRLKQLNDEQLSRIQQLGGNISEQNGLIAELSQTEKHYFEEKDRAKSLQQEVYGLSSSLKDAQQKIDKQAKELLAQKHELEVTQKERLAARNECRDLS